MTPLSDTIIVALISGLCVAVPSLIATYSNNRKNSELLTYQLDQLSKQMQGLEKKVDGIWERVLRLEGRMDKAEAEIQDQKEKKE